MIREVKSFDSLDSYIHHRMENWLEKNPRPDCDVEIEMVHPQKFLQVSSNNEWYISGIPHSSGHVETKTHLIQSGKTVSLILNLGDLDTLIDNLLVLQADVHALHLWKAHPDAQALAKWESKRGNALGEWKREYKRFAEGKVSS